MKICDFQYLLESLCIIRQKVHIVIKAANTQTQRLSFDLDLVQHSYRKIQNCFCLGGKLKLVWAPAFTGRLGLASNPKRIDVGLRMPSLALLFVNKLTPCLS